MNNRKQELAKISHLLHYAGLFPLLTKEQEHEHVNIFQICMRLMPIFIRAASTSRRIRNKTRQQLWMVVNLLAYMKAHAIRIIVSSNLRLVIKYATSYADKGIEIEDLISEGVDGLIHACELFELARNLKLSTYAVPWIRQRMGRAIENKSRVVKTPPHVQAKIYKLNKIYRKWVEKFGEPPTPEEISDQFWEVHKERVTAEEAEELGRLKYSHTSLDETFGEDDNVSVGAYLADEQSKQPDATVEITADKDYVLKDLLSRLKDPEDSKFIMLRFGVGIADEQARTDKELAAMYQCTPREVKEREKRILKELELLADRNSVNMSFQCDVVLEHIAKTSSAMKMIRHITGFDEKHITELHLPCRVARKLSQDAAQEVVDALAMVDCRGVIANHL